MKPIRIKLRLQSLAAALVLAFALVAPQARAADRVALDLAPNSVLSLHGDSNVHHWSSQATKLELKGSIEGSTSPADAVRAGAPFDLEVTIAVKGLKSGKSKLDDNMYSALKEKQNPTIVWRLKSYERPADASADSMIVNAEGTLRVAGQERPVTIKTAVRSEDGKLRVRGEVPLLMTDFGVKPPTMMLGTMRTKNEVLVTFDLALVAAQ